MKTRNIVALLASGAAAFGLVGWRYRRWPCPAWFIAGLENPYFQWVAGADKLLDRAGVRSGMRLLDAGCGPGRVTLGAARRVGSDGRVVALDLQREMLDILERRLETQGVQNVDTLHAGLGAGSLPDDAFDVVLLVTVLGEVPDKRAALLEIRRSLVAGGLLSITEVLPDPHYQTRSAVRAMAEDTGFELGDVFGGPLAYTINLRKPAP